MAQPILTEGEYTVWDLVLTPEKLVWMWRQLLSHPALSLEYGPLGEEGFVALLLNPDSLFFEVQKNGIPVGSIYIAGIRDPERVETHVFFFDSSLSDKVPVCRALAKYIFDTYYFHRINARVPETFGATARFIQKVGFKMEGKRREASFIKGKWRDSLLFGLLPSDLVSVTKEI